MYGVEGGGRNAQAARMVLEKLPAIQSLPPEEKWLLIDELWTDLARPLESAPANAETVAMLEERFAQPLADPAGTSSSAEEVFLAERKRRWK